jgi:uncharacterized protein with FMN-binding domain
MRRTITLLGLLVTGLILVFSPVAGLFEPSPIAAAAPDTVAATTTSSAPGPDPEPTVVAAETPTTTIDSTTSDTTTSTTAANASSSFTVTGPAVRTRYGDFQVEIVVENGALVDVATLQEPRDRRSQSINARAIPQYEAEAIATQSADLDLVSGATYTWRAWTASRAAALQSAGL